MTWEPGCREVPATDPPDYEPADDLAAEIEQDWYEARREAEADDGV